MGSSRRHAGAECARCAADGRRIAADFSGTHHAERQSARFFPERYGCGQRAADIKLALLLFLLWLTQDEPAKTQEQLKRLASLTELAATVPETAEQERVRTVSATLPKGATGWEFLAFPPGGAYDMYKIQFITEHSAA